MHSHNKKNFKKGDYMGKIALTGDRPTGKLHLGHLVGSLNNRLNLQNDKSFDEIYIMLADGQGLTDNFNNPKKIRDNIIQVTLDYLSIGLDPNRVTIFVQSALPALTELTFYYMNLVTVPRLERNPTVKSEMELRGFNSGDEGLPVGFFTYPISQAADITAFDANVVPVGEDQKPMLEQCREIVHKFNTIYGETLVMPEIMLPKNEKATRLKGLDGVEKMSKSLNNCIYISEPSDSLNKKVMSMYTDKNHIKPTDPGNVEGNAVFNFLDIFCEDRHFNDYLNDYKNLDEMKEHYKKGGLGDVKCKKFLYDILEEKISKYRDERNKWENNLSDVYDILETGTKKAIAKSNATYARVKKAMYMDYFDDKNKIVEEWKTILENK